MLAEARVSAPSEGRHSVSVRTEHFSGVLSTEFFDLMCGNVIGEGISRIVYEHALDDKLVVKFEVAKGRFQNVAEWQAWENLSEVKPLARWLAPCVAISPCGMVMLQRRVAPLRKDQAPKVVPAFLTDTKYANWGMFEGRPVCCDYGRNRLQSVGATGRMRKADWWED